MEILGFILVFIGIIKLLIILSIDISNEVLNIPHNLSFKEIKGIIGFIVAEGLIEIFCGIFIICKLL